MNKKKKILCYMDAPSVKTGFGTVSRNILEILHNTGEYDIDIFSINYHGTPHSFPYQMWPAMDHQQGDPYGRKKFCQHAIQSDFDILWVLQDTFIVDFIPELVQHLKQNRKKPFKSIIYYPTDSIIKADWYKNIDPIDYLVSYTNFGKEETLKNTAREDIGVIYHGVNLKDFNVIAKDQRDAFRKQYFGNQSDKFIFMNVNRNQQRKDIPRTIQAFRRVKEQNPDTLLYLHMASKDQGWDIQEICDYYGLSISTDVILPQNFEPNQAYPIEVLNLLYNSVDVVMSTTTGEGFGLSWIESMACKTPVICPNNTAMKELITDDYGYLVDSGSNDSLWISIPNDNNIMRPLVDVDDMVNKMLHVCNNYDEAQEKAEKAYNWVKSTLDWKGDISKQWISLFKKASDKLDMIQSTEVKQEGQVLKTESF